MTTHSKHKNYGLVPRHAFYPGLYHAAGAVFARVSDIRRGKYRADCTVTVDGCAPMRTPIMTTNSGTLEVCSVETPRGCYVILATGACKKRRADDHEMD